MRTAHARNDMCIRFISQVQAQASYKISRCNRSNTRSTARATARHERQRHNAGDKLQQAQEICKKNGQLARLEDSWQKKHDPNVKRSRLRRSFHEDPGDGAARDSLTVLCLHNYMWSSRFRSQQPRRQNNMRHQAGSY